MPFLCKTETLLPYLQPFAAGLLLLLLPLLLPPLLLFRGGISMIDATKRNTYPINV